MKTDREDRGITAVLTTGDDRVITAVRAARDAYAARHGHDIAAIFEDVRAWQETSGRTYVRNLGRLGQDIERLGQAETSTVAQVSAAVRQMERSLRPVLETLNEWSAAAVPVLGKISRIAAAAGEAIEEFPPHQKKYFERIHIHDVLNGVGWLPHRSVPYQLVEGRGEDLARLDRLVDDYYRTQWIKIRDEMNLGLAEYHIDVEARETFGEALAAHEAGLYRCVCRLLFPEIERMIGAGRVGSREMLQTLTDSGDPTDHQWREFVDLVMLERLGTRVYAHVDEAGRETFERDAVPNRHAAMHGLVAYSTHKNSMNMLILTDYVFRILRPKEDFRT